MADEHDVTMMTTPAAKELKEPSVSPAAVTDRTGAEQEALAEYKEKAEHFQRTRYGKSFCNEIDPNNLPFAGSLRPIPVLWSIATSRPQLVVKAVGKL